MKKFKLFKVVAISTLISISSLSAITPVDTKPTQKPMSMRAIFKSLNLTSEQKAQMKQIKADMKAFRKKGRKEMIDRRKNRLKKLTMYLTKDGFDKDAFVKKQLEDIKPRLDFAALTLKKTFDVLTPSQREEFLKKANK